MKRRIAGIAALAGVVAVALGVPGVGTTAPREFTGKPCMDIFVFSPAYAGTVGGTGAFTATLTTAAPSCAGAVYTVTVTDTSTGATQTVTVVGDGTTQEWPINVTYESAPAEVCVSATSRPNSKSNAAADRAPDSGCVTFTPGGGGASGFG